MGLSGLQEKLDQNQQTKQTNKQVAKQHKLEEEKLKWGAWVNGKGLREDGLDEYDLNTLI